MSIPSNKIYPLNTAPFSPIAVNVEEENVKRLEEQERIRKNIVEITGVILPRYVVAKHENKKCCVIL